ncbi:MAG: cobyrinate a,c-diamide synthase [Hyphomicrobiales bacterium]
MQGIVIAGTHSGCGKTTVSLGLMAALVRRGLRIAPFKVGPDFIDPGHHSRVAGVPSRNLDGWMLSREYNRLTFLKAAGNSDVAVVEGVMGLFDGYDGKTEAGSTAQIAKWLGLPVVLVVDVRCMARSAAALVQGFENFDPDLRFAGAVFNHMGSPRHMEYLREALEGAVRMPCLGGILRDEALVIPERHLGLVTPEDHPLDNQSIARLADLVEHGLDLSKLIAGLQDIAGPTPQKAEGPAVPAHPVRIGVARDNAFCFYYPDNLELLEGCGADLVFFSPMQDQFLPPGLDGIYLGGGYPELFAGTLAANESMRRQILEHSTAGLPIYAECGGFMYLCNELQDHQGRLFPMAGCFPFKTRMLQRLKALGYREVRLSRDSIIGSRDMVIRGHEFHYSEMMQAPSSMETVYRIADRGGEQRPLEGYASRRTLGSYIHLHFGSAPQAAEALVESCRTYRAERTRNA